MGLFDKFMDVMRLNSDDDDDDFFEDDIDIKDTVDFSHYTEEEFAKLDDFYAMANMSHQTYEKFKEIKKR